MMERATRRMEARVSIIELILFNLKVSNSHNLSKLLMESLDEELHKKTKKMKTLDNSCTPTY